MSKYLALFFLIVSTLYPVNTTHAIEMSVSGFNSASCTALKKKAETESCVTLHVSGEISSGDTQKFIEYRNGLLFDMAEATNYTVLYRIGSVSFSSNGGDVYEALKLGREIRKMVVNTHVYPDHHCYSSCVFAFLGGIFRTPIGKIGIHSMYSNSYVGSYDFKSADSAYQKTSIDIEQYLKEMRVSTVLLDEMNKIPHKSLAILSWDRCKEFGIFGIDPVYAQTHNVQKGISTFLLE